MKAIIFNSGMGKRMGDLTKNNHKSMVVLANGETIFDRQIRILSENGITEFIVTTGPFKEQFEEAALKYPNLKFHFVFSPRYLETNYIYSMYLARELMNDDMLLLHGDLVFNSELVSTMLNSDDKSLCLFNELKALPQKDFKGRIRNNLLKEVSINIFDEDCYAFQPLYKLSKEDVKKWVSQVEQFISNGNDKVYAENALNEILDNMQVKAMSYKDHYIDEVDTKEDLLRVSEEINKFDSKNNKSFRLK